MVQKEPISKKKKIDWAVVLLPTLVTALMKAKEKGETAYLYLTVNDRDPEQIANVALAIEHVEIALEHLGVGEP